MQIILRHRRLSVRDCGQLFGRGLFKPQNFQPPYEADEENYIKQAEAQERRVLIKTIAPPCLVAVC